MFVALVIASCVLSGHICETGNGSAPCIDILLSGPPNARVDDLINVDISIVAQQDEDATPGEWAGVEVVVAWDPTVLEPVSHTICNSLFDYFLVMLFVSDDPGSLYFDCINEDVNPQDGWPDNDGDLSVIYFAPLGSNQNVFAIPAILGTLQFRVLGPGDHTVSIVPVTDCLFDGTDEGFPVETSVVAVGNVNVTGNLTDTYEVEVRHPLDTVAPPGVGIEDLLALLAAWGE